MAEQPIPISEIADPDVIRVKLLASGKDVHAPMGAVAAASIHGAPTKTTPVDADEFGYWDSVGLQTVKTTWANIKATIWTALGALINGGTGKTTPVDADMFAIADSAASNATKKLTWANLKATLKTYFDTLYQPLAATLTSWAAVTRASGFDTFAATPSSANFATLLTDESGTGVVPFQDAGTFTPAFSATGATFSYANQSGRYTKIGNMVFYDVVLSLNTSGNTLTANPLSVTGMPFSSAAGFAGVVPIRFANSTTSYVGVYVRVTGTTLVFEGLTAAATTNSTALNSNALLHATTGSVIQIRGMYPV